MRQLRFGSYSIAVTVPGTSMRERLKSTSRYWRSCRPPLWRTVMRPWLLRPAWYFRRTHSDFSGLPLVISAKSGMVAWRAPADELLRLRKPMSDSLDLLAFDQADDGLLPRGGHAGQLGAHPPRLAAAVHGVH